MMRIVVTLFALASVSRGESIRDVDFKNFAYPFIKNEFDSVPDKLRWMLRTRTNLLALHDGRYTFPCEDTLCPPVTIDQINFGNINGRQSAAMAQGVPASRPVDQDAPHRLGGRAKKMRPALPFYIFISGEPQPGFMHQRRGLECPVRGFICHPGGGKLAQLFIYQRQ